MSDLFQFSEFLVSIPESDEFQSGELQHYVEEESEVGDSETSVIVDPSSDGVMVPQPSGGVLQSHLQEELMQVTPEDSGTVSDTMDGSASKHVLSLYRVVSGTRNYI